MRLKRSVLRALALAVLGGVIYMLVTGRGYLPEKFGPGSTFTWHDDPIIFLVATALYLALAVALWFGWTGKRRK